MSTHRCSLVIVLIALSSLLQGSNAYAINIVIDYTYDTQDFFGASNPDGAAAGAQARTSLEVAASFFSNLLEDTFDPIITPAQFNSSFFGGQVTWSWEHSFTHPGTGAPLTVTDIPFAQDEYRIYAGGRSLSDTTLGRGGPGGFGWSTIPNGGGFTSQEIDQINAITDDFSNAVENRGETNGFSRWGGDITFDNDGSIDWHFDQIAPPTGSAADFFSVALHEIGHTLGIGTSDDWNSFLSVGNFNGPQTVAEFGGPVPAGAGHFAENVMGKVLGTNIDQEVSMDPNLSDGTRKLWTNIDAAALSDIGWEVASVPEPSTILLFALAGLGFFTQFKRDKR